MKLVAYVAAALALLAPAYAQSTQKEKPCSAAIEFADGDNASWYVVKGLRASAECSTPAGDFSAIFVPFGETMKLQQDAFLSYKLPKKLTGKTEVRAIGENTYANGPGGGLDVARSVGQSSERKVSLRAEAFKNGTAYGYAKYLGENYDLDFGMKAVGNSMKPFGYVTFNRGGKWDDSVSLGVDPSGKIWSSAGIERKNNAVLAFGFYQPRTGDLTFDAYVGHDGINRGPFTREIDRLIANNNVNPKGRTEVLNLPPPLFIGKWAGELRADKSPADWFVNASVDRNFNVGKGVSAGVSAGIEHFEGVGEKRTRPIGEFLVKAPLKFLGPKCAISYSRSFGSREAHGLVQLVNLGYTF